MFSFFNATAIKYFVILLLIIIKSYFKKVTIKKITSSFLKNLKRFKVSSRRSSSNGRFQKCGKKGPFVLLIQKNNLSKHC